MYSINVVLFSKTLSYLISRSHQIIVLVSMLPEFAEQSWFLCSVSADFGSRLLTKHGSAFITKKNIYILICFVLMDDHLRQSVRYIIVKNII